MPEEQENNENAYVICPVCEGTGKSKLGIGCQNCSGMGLGTFFEGRFFFWGPKLGKAVIELGHVKKKGNIIINLASAAFAVVGIVCLGIWIYTISQNTVELNMFAFWRERHPLIMVFWLSMYAVMFIFYRMSEEERRQHRIKPLTYDERQINFDIPDNWKTLKSSKSAKRIDVSTGFTLQTHEFVEQAYLLADSLNHKYVTPIHLFFSVLADTQVAAMFSRLNVDNQLLIEKVKQQLERVEISEDRTALSRTTKEVLVESYLESYKLGQEKVTPKNMIISAVEHDRMLKEILLEFEVDTGKIYNVIMWFLINERLIEGHKAYRKSAAYKPSTAMDRAYTSVATPILDQAGYDLTIAAKWGRLEYCVARDKELESIFQNFESGYSGVMLVGPTGVGKNTVINGIAQMMVKEDVPKDFKDKRLVEIDAARLIGGASAGQAEGRLLQIVDEIARAGNIIAFINNIEQIIGITSGSEESLDLAEVLASALERHSFLCLAAASDNNYHKHIEGGSLDNVMAKVKVEEPAGDQAIQIIESKIGMIEGKHNVFFSYNAIEDVIKMTTKYIHDKYLPAKAITVLELVAVKVLKKRGPQSLVSKDDVAEVISEITNIPVTKVSENEKESLINLEDKIHERMVDQEEAVHILASSLRRARTQLREGKRPIANFLFLGPTGVGKTELAKTVSQIYFGKEEYMIRVDMSEYQHPDSVKKMIGDASGVRGYLTEKVRKAPFSLILLDEIEKAHPDIMNLFLQVMDDGRLTDGQGRTVDFTNSILIATSNAGAIYIQEQVKAGTDIKEIENYLINEHLNQFLRPELINRFDGVIVFKPLDMDDVIEITRLMLNQTGKMLDKKGINLRVEEQGIRILAKAGFDPKFGARPLRRLLQERVDDSIANLILSGQLKRRDTVVIGADASVTVEKAPKI